MWGDRGHKKSLLSNIIVTKNEQKTPNGSLSYLPTQFGNESLITPSGLWQQEVVITPFGSRS